MGDRTPRESDIRADIKRALRKHGAFVRVIHGSAEQAGLPDLLVVVNGLTILLEVKRGNDPRSNLTPLQHQVIGEVLKRRGLVAVVRSAEQAVALVRRLCEAIEPPSPWAFRLVEQLYELETERMNATRKKTPPRESGGEGEGSAGSRQRRSASGSRAR